MTAPHPFCSLLTFTWSWLFLFPFTSLPPPHCSSPLFPNSSMCPWAGVPLGVLFHSNQSKLLMSSFKKHKDSIYSLLKTQQWLTTVVRIKDKILTIDYKVPVLGSLPASLSYLLLPLFANSTGATGTSVPPASESKHFPTSGSLYSTVLLGTFLQTFLAKRYSLNSNNASWDKLPDTSLPLNYISLCYWLLYSLYTCLIVKLAITCLSVCLFCQCLTTLLDLKLHVGLGACLLCSPLNMQHLTQVPGTSEVADTYLSVEWAYGYASGSCSLKGDGQYHKSIWHQDSTSLGPV